MRKFEHITLAGKIKCSMSRLHLSLICAVPIFEIVGACKFHFSEDLSLKKTVFFFLMTSLFADMVATHAPNLKFKFYDYAGPRLMGNFCFSFVSFDPGNVMCSNFRIL